MCCGQQRMLELMGQRAVVIVLVHAMHKSEGCKGASFMPTL